MSKRLSVEDWVFIGGLVAKEYQNARRALLRAGTPIANEKAGARVKLVERLMLNLSRESRHE